MRLRFWGTRGSVPTPGPDTVRYGGNTACVELRGPNDEVLVFDAGTGARALGNRLLEESRGEPINLNLLLSHLHWDHIQGLPFFRPAYDQRTVLSIYGPEQRRRPRSRAAGHERRQERRSLRGLLGIGMDDPFFPVDLEALPARLVVNEMDGGPLTLGPFRVSGTFVFHPSVCLAYRVECADGSVVYATDTEDPFSGRPNPVVELAREADILIHDAQYLPEDLKPGWGHSTVDSAVDVALRAGARHLVLYHHDPERRDDAIDRILDRARRIVGERRAALEVTAAREGLELRI